MGDRIADTVQPTEPWLRLRLLGGCEFRCPDGPVRLETAKTGALLAYLAMRPGPQQRHSLMGLLWGDMPEPNARRNLRRALWDLRRKLPATPPFILATRQTVEFNRQSDYWLDVALFERMAGEAMVSFQTEGSDRVDLPVGRLQSTVELYRGDFLEGFHVRGAPAFEEWMLAERERLRTLALLILQQLLTQYTARGEYKAGILCARRLLALAPWREETHRELMRMLALTGQRSAALAQYEECRRLLKRELELEPLEETTALYQRIRDSHACAPMEIGPAGEAADLQPREFASLPFVGREEEHAALVEWWEEALRRSSGQAGGDRGRLALVEGEAGVGKTRLVEEVARYIAAQGAAVLRGRCYEFGSGLPYQPVAESLRGYLHALSTATHPTPSLPKVWWAELGRLLPEMRVLHSDLPQPAAVSGEAARQRLFEAVARLLLAVCDLQSALCLFLDDLHWADQSTLDLLHYLVRHLQEAPVWIVGTYRPEEIQLGHPLMQLRLGLGRDRLVDILTLEPLSSAAVSSIARSLVGERGGDSLGRFLYRESEGNPFVLSEMVEMLREDRVLREQADGWEFVRARLREIGSPQPASVRDVILQRVGRLGDTARRLLMLAAVIGRQFDVALLQAAAGQDADAVDRSLGEWLARRLVKEVPHPRSAESADPGLRMLDFSHDKIRAVVYRAIEPAQRRLLHRRVGQALETSPTTVEGHPGMLAHHWEQAGEARKATAYLLRAGDQARLVYAHREAVEYYQRALAHLKALGDREQAAHTLMKLGLTYHNAFDFRRAHQAYDEGFVLWQQAGAAHQTTPALPASYTLRVRWLEPVTLDPAISPDDHTACLVAHLFSGLVELDPEMYVVPDIARTWEVSDGGRRFVFHLRDDVRWSDGRPVTAQDFEYAWKRVLNPATGASTAPLLYDIRGAKAYHRGGGGPDGVGVQAVDATTLVVELERPIGYFLQLLTHASCYPVPRHVVEAHGPAWMEAAHIVTNGPFRLASWKQGQSLTIERNPGYHGQFKGNLQRVVLLPIADWAIRLQMYEQDQLDVLGITFFPPAEREEVRQRHAGEYISKPRLETHYIAFDVRRPPFDDVRVRRAFVMAADRERLANIHLMGYAAPGTGGLVPPGMPGHFSDIGLPYDPRQARRLLAAAGYPDGQGFPTVNGLVFRAAASRGAYLQAQWRENLGVRVVWEVKEWTAFVERLRHALPPLVSLGWIADYPDPDNFLRVSRARSWPWWQNDAYDRLVEQAGKANDREERLRLYRQAERVLSEEAAVFPLVYERDHLLMKPWVNRYPMSGVRSAFWKDVVLTDRPALAGEPG